MPDRWHLLSVLKSAQVVPEEIEILREISRLDALRGESVDADERSALGQRIAELRVRYDLSMQRYRRRS